MVTTDWGVNVVVRIAGRHTTGGDRAIALRS
jgi:hypothetical protein